MCVSEQFCQKHDPNNSGIINLTKSENWNVTAITSRWTYLHLQTNQQKQTKNKYLSNALLQLHSVLNDNGF